MSELPYVASLSGGDELKPAAIFVVVFVLGWWLKPAVMDLLKHFRNKPK